MLIFDIETDGLLDTMTKIHCLSISDEHHNVTGYRPEEVEAGVKRLWEAVNNGEGICGHNIINFDIPAIHKIYPWFEIPRDKRKFVVDTLVLARLVFSNISESDYGAFRRKEMPG